MTTPRLRLSIAIVALANLFGLACSKEGLLASRRDAGAPSDTGGSPAGGSVGSGGSLTGSGGAGGNPGSGGSATGSGGATSAPDGAPQTCIENGQTYGVGESFKRDCNTCTCTATGVMCTTLACPRPDGGPADAMRAPDAGRPCEYGGRVYAVGESFSIDCNTCTCATNGLMCTAKICFGPDAAMDSPLPRDGSAACAVSSNLTFGSTGGNTIYTDVNRLTATTFTITRDYTGRATLDGGSTATCSPSLPACGAAGAVTAATINADLADPDVQSLWTGPPDRIPVYGVDERPSDGAVYSIALDDGHKVLVGGQCASPVMSSCRYIPAGLVQLVDDLKKLASAMAADPACKGL